MSAAALSPSPAPRRAGVVLLHGLARSRFGMIVLARRLEAAGFETARIGYRSRSQSLAQSVAAVARQIEPLAARWEVIHIAGHSLGGLIGAALLAQRPDLPIGRVVAIGAPLRGSPLAELAGRIGPLRAFFGPVLAELAADGGAWPAAERLGAIAGVSGSALWRLAGLEGPHDGRVVRESAWAGAGHRVAIPAGHALQPLDAQVARLTAHFLQHGVFPGEDA